MVGRQVGVKCCGVQGFCVGGRSDVRTCWSMVQVAVSTKTNRDDAAARRILLAPPRAHGRRTIKHAKAAPPHDNRNCRRMPMVQSHSDSRRGVTPGSSAGWLWSGEEDPVDVGPEGSRALIPKGRGSPPPWGNSEGVAVQ